MQVVILSCRILTFWYRCLSVGWLWRTFGQYYGQIRDGNAIWLSRVKWCGKGLSLFAWLRLWFRFEHDLHLHFVNFFQTTLLRRISRYDIEAFPRRVRVLHVEQEVLMDSVLSIVANSLAHLFVFTGGRKRFDCVWECSEVWCCSRALDQRRKASDWTAAKRRRIGWCW